MTRPPAGSDTPSVAPGSRQPTRGRSKGGRWRRGPTVVLAGVLLSAVAAAAFVNAWLVQVQLIEQQTYEHARALFDLVVITRR